MFPFTRTVLFSRCVCGAYREERACRDFGSVHLCSSCLRAVGRQRIPQTLRVRAQPAPFAASFIFHTSPPPLSPGEGMGSPGGCGEPQEEGQRAPCWCQLQRCGSWCRAGRVFKPRPQCLQLMELIHSVNSALPPCPHCGQGARRLQAGTATLAPAGSAAKSCSWQGQAEVRRDGRARTG